MQYKQIFTDAKYSGNQFFRVTVYEPELGTAWKFPSLIEYEHGDKQIEDWERDWEVSNKRGATIIRDAIKIIDNYKFPPEQSNG